MEAEEMKKNKNWSHLPTGIIEIFCKKLARQCDKVRLCNKCSTWHCRSLNNENLYVRDTPWLMTNDDTSSLFRLFCPTLKETFKMYKPFRPLRDSLVVGSFKGWLVIRSQLKVFILNLFTKFRIQLPPRTAMPEFLKPNKRSNDVVQDYPLTFAFSTSPNLFPATVAAVTFGGDLVWCKVGDKEWKGHVCQGNKPYASLTFHNRNLYAITKDGAKIDIFQVNNEESESAVLVKVKSLPCPTPKPSTRAVPSDLMDVYLVECNGAVVAVKRYYAFSRIEGPTVGFDVFKVQENCEVVKLESLGDQALFVSDLNCESVAVRDCRGLEQDANRIYFLGHSANGSMSEVGVFSVKDNSCRLRFRVPLYQTANMVSQIIWFFPSFAFASDCKCRDMPIKSTRKRARIGN